MISGAEARVAPGRTQPIFLEGKLLSFQPNSAADLGLKDGQIVQASVRLQNEQPMLMLQGRLLPAPGLQMSRVGESIWLKAQGGALVPINAPPIISRIASLLYRPSVGLSLIHISEPTRRS